MSDFDSDWKISGTPDPATPDPQPSQVQAQPVQVPVQPQPAPQVPVQPAQPYQQNGYAYPAQPQAQQPVYQQPVYQQPAYQQPAYHQQRVYPGAQAAPAYGYPAQQAPYQQVDYAAFNAQREQSLNECQKMINHFSPKVDLFQKYENCNRDITRYSRSPKNLLIWGIVLGSLGIVNLVIELIRTKSPANKIIVGIFFGAVILAGAAMILAFFLQKKSRSKKLETLIAQAGEMSTELTLLYNRYGNCTLASEYVDPRILFKIQSLILTGRCATINDALNLLLTYQRNYATIQAAKSKHIEETEKRYEGKAAYFNAVRYFNLR